MTWTKTGFNPSSIGIGFRRSSSFSGSNNRQSFQSFFYWNWLSKPGNLARSIRVLDRFNPSSIGIGFRRPRAKVNLIPSEVFQSFFYWNWLSKAILTCIKRPKTTVSILLLLELAFEAAIAQRWNIGQGGFNPSSIGIGFRRRPCRIRFVRATGFQSFFYWNWLSKPEQPQNRCST